MEVFVLEAGDVLRERDPACRGVDRARHAEHDAVDEVVARAGCVEQRPGERLDRIERRVGSALGQLDVLPRADVAADVAHGAAHEAGAEVEADDERRLGHRLEERRSVAGSVVGALGLAYEARAEERLKRLRHRRLRDADAPRDLGPRDGRARPDRLEDRALVQVLEERRGGAACCHRSCQP